MFILTSSKRAVKLVDGTWEADEEDFLRRWPDNKRPDIGIQRSESATKLIEQANRLNEAQLRSGFLDWLYAVDVDVPVHDPCNALCPTHKDHVKEDDE
jgi:hypothetical protein